jgi:hypothetical protein
VGFFPQLTGGASWLLATPQGRKRCDELRGGNVTEAAVDIILSLGQGPMRNGSTLPGAPAYGNAWMETQYGPVNP